MWCQLRRICGPLTMPRRRHRKRGSEVQEVRDGPGETSPTTYTVKKSDVLGRYLVAHQDLPEGVVIISEDALVVGPAQDSSPVCLGCYSPLPPDLTTAIRCDKCHWPLCSSTCKGLFRRLGHSREECAQLVACGVASPQLLMRELYNAIVPLRCLLLRDHHPHMWDTLRTMQAHDDTRRSIPTIWDYNQRSVVDRIRGEWKLTKYSEEEIHTTCGILEVNAFAVGEDSLNIRGLYPTAFLIAHDCVSNTAHTDDDEFRMTIFSTVPILKDGLITLSYTNSLEGTKQRREHLKQCKFFSCECARCRDPTELGTYLSAVKCAECTSGHLLPTEPLTDQAVWRCDNKRCRSSLSADHVSIVVNRIGTEIKALDQSSVQALESSVRRYSSVLHRNHFHLLGLKYTLSQLYGKAVGFLIHQMSEALLERKRQVCEDILQLFDMLEPGLTRTRGLTMYELHAPIMVLTIQRFEMCKICKADLCRKLRKVASYLRECSRILKFEPEGSQEGCIRGAAAEALIQLRSWESVVGKL